MAGSNYVEVGCGAIVSAAFSRRTGTGIMHDSSTHLNRDTARMSYKCKYCLMKPQSAITK
uniref:Uncharacterized protein n=1 Tax=Anguilla anguilla TaxID=7936 RepID=A0A0E9S7J3_ANGAN